ncbi:MAG TPA: molybdate ABC transporter permease subunit [Alphaproteobacteria bacterium]|nr:molybdate ABC transporter permease subunit [Alphaproteobacteria bacterium]
MNDARSFLALTPEEWQAVALSLRVAVCSVVFSLPPAILVGWLLGRSRFLGKSLFDAFVHLPFVLPPVVTGYLLLLVFGLHGPLGSLLNDWFGIRLAFTTAGAVLATAVMTFPLMVRAIRLSAGAVDRKLEDAARTLGARPLDRFFSITLPLMAPGIAAGAMTAFAAALGEFGAVITFAASIPGETQTLPLAIYGALQSPGGEAVAARLSIVSFALALVALILSERIARYAQDLQRG